MIRVTRERHCRPSSSSEALQASPDPGPCGAVCLPGLSQALEPRRSSSDRHSLSSRPAPAPHSLVSDPELQPLVSEPGQGTL